MNVRLCASFLDDLLGFLWLFPNFPSLPLTFCALFANSGWAVGVLVCPLGLQYGRC